MKISSEMIYEFMFYIMLIFAFIRLMKSTVVINYKELKGFGKGLFSIVGIVSILSFISLFVNFFIDGYLVLTTSVFVSIVLFLIIFFVLFVQQFSFQGYKSWK